MDEQKLNFDIEKIKEVLQPKQLTVSDLSSSERKKWVMQQYLKGRYPADVFAEYEQTYSLSKSSYEKDVSWMYEQLEKRRTRDANEIIDKHLDYLYDIYQECRDSNDKSTALKTLKEIRETLGLGGTKVKTAVQINQTVNNNTMPKLSIEEIKSLLGRNESSVFDTDNNRVIDITPTDPISE